mgnify:CR=1 FL=1
MNFPLFIARRIYSGRDSSHAVSQPAIRIALAGIVVGLAVMIVSICVVMGFKHEVASKVIGFGSHIQVISLTQDQYMQRMPVLTTDSLEQAVRHAADELPLIGMAASPISHVQRYAVKMGMLKTNDDFLGLQFKGAGEDYDSTFFAAYTTEGRLPRFSSSEASNDLMISRRTANDLGLNVGDRVFAYFVGNDDMRARRFNVCGIYETNLSEYDRSVVLTDIYTIRRLNGWDANQSSGFEVQITDFDLLDAVTDCIHQKVGRTIDDAGCTYGVFNIRELAPNIFSWLGVLDVNVIMILVLMICVASFTVASGLLIIMLERIQMIGVLKALGATNNAVRRVFVNFAIMLVGRGMVWGNIIGLTICWLQSRFHIIGLDASVYYIDSVPIRFNWILIIAVNIITLVISSVVIFGSSYLMGISRPARTMHFE